MAGVTEPNSDTRGDAAGLPSVDGKDLTRIITAEEQRYDDSPWAGIPILLSSFAADPVINPHPSNVLMLNGLKLITGTSTCGTWSAVNSPNVTHRFGSCPDPYATSTG